MKFRIIIDKEREEEVTVCAHEETNLTAEIERLCREDAIELIGYKDRDAVKVEMLEVYCFIVEDGKIFAITENDKLQLKCRLYTVEERLTDSFVKINQSCIANIRMIERFEASIGGALTVKFKNGYCDYVSRRNLKKVKERLGL